MTDIEQLARRLCDKTNDWYYELFIEALTTAYEKGKHDAYANQRTAARENGKKGGRKEGSKDTKPRTRRSKAEIEKEVKP